jgi:hypothetical protein
MIQVVTDDGDTVIATTAAGTSLMTEEMKGGALETL